MDFTSSAISKREEANKKLGNYNSFFSGTLYFIESNHMHKNKSMVL